MLAPLPFLLLVFLELLSSGKSHTTQQIAAVVNYVIERVQEKLACQHLKSSEVFGQSKVL